MEATREEMKAEAIARMKMLGIVGNAIREFEQKEKLNYSDRTVIGKTRVGVIYWLDDRMQALVQLWEQRTGNLVYHVIRTNTEIGELLDCLYVSKNPEEWKTDRNDIGNGQTISYTINTSDPSCSEGGYIGIEAAHGGLLRIW